MASQLRVDKIVPVDGVPTSGGGGIVQCVSTTKTDTFTTASTSFVDVTGLSATITPTSATSKILVTVDMRLSTNTNRNITYRLMRGSTAIYVGDASSSRTQATGGFRMTDDASYEMHTQSAVFLDSPATTSATTYKVMWTQTYDSSGEYAYINRSYDDNDADDRNRCASSITVMEIAV